jgi:hypothetical protein
LVIICVLFLSTLSVTNANIFDLRTGKNTEYRQFSVTFDNLPHLYCCSPLSYGYSGIYVGDTIIISGRINNGGNLTITFPSGKKAVIEGTSVLSDGSNPEIIFKKEITFNEEGICKVNNSETFEVCYRAVPVRPCILLKDIIGERKANDEYTKTFTNWNNAVAVEEGTSKYVNLLIVDKNGDPLPYLSANKFKTDKYGIARIKVDSNEINAYGDVKVVKYEKFIFDTKGNLQYASGGIKNIDALEENGVLFINPSSFLSFFVRAPLASFLTIKDNYIYSQPLDTAYPTAVKDLDGKVYVEIGPILGTINLDDILGSSIQYYSDRTEIFIAVSNAP